MTTIGTQMSANTQILAERLTKPDLQAKLDEMDAKLKAHEERLAKEQAAQAKLNDIKRLGGIRQYEDLTAEKYTDKAILKAMANFPKENFYLWGAAGVGKTHAAVAIIRQVRNAQVVRMSQISRCFRKELSVETEDKYISQFAQIPMLLDDLGSEKMTEYLQGILFEIIDRRWSNKVGGLIITANINIAGLSKIVGDRTASRIAGLVGTKNILELSGSDRRIDTELF